VTALPVLPAIKVRVSKHNPRRTVTSMVAIRVTNIIVGNVLTIREVTDLTPIPIISKPYTKIRK
jgi:hypothetical protein